MLAGQRLLLFVAQGACGLGGFCGSGSGGFLRRCSPTLLEGDFGLLRLVLAYPVVDAAEIFPHASAAELIDALHQSVEEVAVVAHDDHRAVEGLDGTLEHVLALEVEVVGGLVEDEAVDGLQQELDHRQSGAFAAGEHLHLLVGGLAAEHEGAQYVAYLQPYVAAGHAVDGLEHGELAVEQLRLVLCEVADLHVVTHLERALKGYFAQDALHQRTLALAVAAHEGHLLAAPDGQVDVVEDGAVVVLAHLVADHGEVAAPLRTGELQAQGAGVHLVHLDGDDLLQLPHLLLHLHGLGGLVAEALDEGLRLLYLAALVFVGAQLLFAAFGAQREVFVVLHLVVVYLAAGDLYGACGHVVDEGPVVRDEHHGAVVACEELLEPLYRLDVEMVGGLVEQQHVGVAQQDFGQLDAHPPSAAELAGRAVQVALFEAQSFERALHLAAIVVAAHHAVALALVGEALAQSHVVLRLVVGAPGHLLLHLLHAALHGLYVGEGGLGLFGHGAPVGEHHHLGQIAHRRVARYGDAARCGPLQSGNHLEHGALPRPVFADEGDAVAVVDDVADVGE